MFSAMQVNRGRQPEIDIARGLAVLFMIIIHVQLYFASGAVLDTWLADINDFNGDIPAAPMFMFLLGVGINYSRNNDPATLARRGLGLFCTGYLLGLVRGLLPNALLAYRTAGIRYFYKGLDELMFVDILQFAGLAMMMLALFCYLDLGKRMMVLLVLLFSAANIVLLPFRTDMLPASALAGLLWGSHDSAFFPFLTWFFYPVAGFIFGSYLIRCADKSRFYRMAGLVAGAVFVASILFFNVWLGLPTGMTGEYSYYHHIITDNITFTAGVILELSLLSLIARRVPAALMDVAVRWSRHVTPIYCIHWVMITWLALVLPGRSLSMLPFILLVVLIVVLSDVLATWYAGWKRSQAAQVFPRAGLILAGTLMAMLGGMATWPPA